MVAKFCMWWAVFQFLLKIGYSEHDYKLLLNKFECRTIEPRWYEYFLCSLREEGPGGDNYGSLTFAVKKRLQTMPISLQFSIQRPHKPRLKLLNITFDLCTIFKSVEKRQLLGILVKEFSAYFEEFPTCPMKQNFNYTVAKYRPSLKNYPQHLPVGKYIGSIGVIEDERVVVDINIETKVLSTSKG